MALLFASPALQFVVFSEVDEGGVFLLGNSTNCCWSAVNCPERLWHLPLQNTQCWFEFHDRATEGTWPVQYRTKPDIGPPLIIESRCDLLRDNWRWTYSSVRRFLWNNLTEKQRMQLCRDKGIVLHVRLIYEE